MRTTKNLARRASTLTAMTAAGVLALSMPALADDISNTLDASIDATAEVMPLNVGGPNGTTQLTVTPTNGDGKQGCNLTGSTELTLRTASSNTSVATVSPASVTFTSCSESKTLTVTPVSVGTATVSTSQTANNTGATFNLAPATFTVNVAPPANTAPSISVSGVTAGTNYATGTVPSAVCTVTDAEDGNSSFAATVSAVTGPYAADGIGSQTAGCSYTDRGGLTTSASETYYIVDPTAPSITKSVTGRMGDNGWYTGDVNLDWTVSEDESPSSLALEGCDDQSITADQGETTYTCSATSAGGAADEQSVTIKRDATAPTVTGGTPTGTAGSNGWYRSDVTVPFTATDALSGPSTATQYVTSSGEGSDVTVESPTFSDNAGNTAGTITRSFKVDKNAPTDITFSGGTRNVYFGDPQTAPTCEATDTVSGMGTCTVSGGGTALGTQTWTATATDRAGNESTSYLSYEVLAWRTNGFYSPVDTTTGTTKIWNTAKGGSTIPLKFEVFAGSTEITDVTNVKLTYASVTPPSTTASADEIETVVSVASNLRYDATGGQFIQNWKTPAGAGAYKVTMTAADGTTAIAYFNLRK